MPWWAWVWPLLAWIVLAAAWAAGADGAVMVAPMVTAEAVLLIATVFAAVYHAEVVAHRVGEPFGTLVLAARRHGDRGGADRLGHARRRGGHEGLARDTVFAAVMIICNGMVGLCLLLGGVRHHEQGFQAEGASAALAVLAALVTLTLVLPNFTTAAPGPVFSTSQLVFAGIVSLVLYGVVRVRADRPASRLLPADPDTGLARTRRRTRRRPPASRRWTSARAAADVRWRRVVGLAKALTPAVDAGVAVLGAPKAVVGIVIAALVLLPEGLAALRAARAQPPADQPEPGARLGARQHRPDHPGRRGRLDRAGHAAGARSGVEGADPARADPARSRDHAGHRPHHGPARRRAPGDPGGLPVSRGGAVSGLMASLQDWTIA